MSKGLALVTGASSGIGYELAKLLADDGYDLVVAADADVIHASADKLGAGGANVQAVQVDLRRAENVESMYQTATSGGRQLDVAVINAGTGRAGPFVEGDLDVDLSIVDLNVRSTTQLTKLVLRDMVARDEGKVLLTSSIAAMMPGSLQTVYNASKSFIQSLSEALYDELRDTGVTVTALMPGPTETDFFRRGHMLDTVVGRMPKDDPAAVARQGYEALMRGDRKVVAESVMTKVMGLANRVLPDSVKAVASRVISSPVRGH